jgi:antitoxin component YwqK of YwqJK toxin-antitoxin module
MMKRLLLIVLPLLMIVGCSKPVEDSTLINKDGLMYLPESETPYSGEVFTNYDTGEKLYTGRYENGLLIEYSYLKKDGSVKEPINYEETLNEIDEVFYTKDTNKPYSGQVFSLYDDGKELTGGTLKDGKRDGVWTSWHKNGQKWTEGTFKNGEMGLYTIWYENGKKKVEITYKYGKEIERLEWTYYENGIFLIETFKNGEMGLYTIWYGSGRKKIEGTYKDGKKDGLWTEWDGEGQKISEITYKDGIFTSNTSDQEDWNDYDGKGGQIPPKLEFIQLGHRSNNFGLIVTTYGSNNGIKSVVPLSGIYGKLEEEQPEKRIGNRRVVKYTFEIDEPRYGDTAEIRIKVVDKYKKETVSDNEFEYYD